MKKRNCWAILGICAAAAAVLMMAVILIGGIFIYGNGPAVNVQQKGFRGVAIQPPDDAYAANVRVDSPKEGGIIASPLTITGTARGWYFEGTFPVELKDADGKTLATGQAQAQGDWTSPDFVPFTASLDFAAPSTATGTLVLKKDNPSGLPQNDASATLRVEFAPAAALSGDCHPTGCSGQLCSDSEQISDCLYLPAYACYKQAVCARQADGQCGWNMTPQLEACLQGAPGPAVNPR